MSNLLSEIMLAAAKVSYTVNGAVVQPLPAGYAFDGNFGVGGILAVPDTGFQAIALRNATSSEYIIAFTGTQDGQHFIKLGPYIHRPMLSRTNLAAFRVNRTAA